MNILILTNEYPPHVYGGAGVHVNYLTRELKKLISSQDYLQVLCFGDQQIKENNFQVQGIDGQLPYTSEDPKHNKVLNPLYKNLIMSSLPRKVDLVHCHTWYTHLAGCLIKNLFQARLVLTTHSLEPHRPWKADQLGTGYQVSTWLEGTAYKNADGIIAVSESMSQNVQDLYSVSPEKIRVIHNGIDLQEYQPVHKTEVLEEFGIDPQKPYVFFVGRITAQKGIIHLVKAISYLPEGSQVVLCAASSDTREILDNMCSLISWLREQDKQKIIWIDHPIPEEKKVALYAQAAVFVCPSVYEPFGIINLEAMSCGTPVIASKIGGIPEIVVPEETGLLVPLERTSSENPEPKDPQKFSSDLAQSINRLLADPELRQTMGQKSRQRVKEKFSWSAIAEKTLNFYQQLVP